MYDGNILIGDVVRFILCDVCCDSVGYILVVDIDNCLIYLFDEDGYFICYLWIKVDKLFCLYGFFVDKEDRLWVVEWFFKKIRVF